MKKFFRKSLVYLIMTMLLLPTWVMTSFMGAEKAEASGSILDPVVTEVYVSDNNDWIEIYNPNVTESINLNGYAVKKKRVLPNSPIVTTFTLGNIDLGPREIIAIDKIQFSPALDLSNDYTKIWELSFVDPAGNKLQNELNYGGLTFRWPSMAQSLQYNIAKESWSVVVANPGEYDEHFPTIEISGIPTVTNQAVDITLSAENADEIWYKYYLKGDDELDSSFLMYNGEGITIPAEINTARDYYFVAIAQNDLGQYVEGRAEFTIDTISPVITVDALTTNKTKPAITGTIDDPEADIAVAIEGNSYLAKNNGDGTWVLEENTLLSDLASGIYNVDAVATDVAGNSLADPSASELTIDLIAPVSPAIVTNVKNKTITISWDAVSDAVRYIVYSNPKSNGEITKINYAKKAESTGTTYDLAVSAYGDYYIAVTAVDIYGNESTIPTIINGQKLVNVVEPIVPVAPVAETIAAPAPVVPTAAPVKAKAAVQPQPEEQKVETPVDEGVIKGDETKEDEATTTNWTPWIILFILIILAGAATGGYFYWFAGKEEQEEAPKKNTEKKDKVIVTVKDKQGKQANKKSKRW